MRAISAENSGRSASDSTPDAGNWAGADHAPSSRANATARIVALLIDARGFEVSGFDDGKLRGIDMRPQRRVDLIHSERGDFLIHLRIPVERAVVFIAQQQERQQRLILRSSHPAQ